MFIYLYIYIYGLTSPYSKLVHVLYYRGGYRVKLSVLVIMARFTNLRQVLTLDKY